MNITPHPPNDDGKDVMFKALNSFLKKTSSRMKENVDAMEVKMDGFEGDLPIGNDEKSAVVDDILSDDDDEMEWIFWNGDPLGRLLCFKSWIVSDEEKALVLALLLTLAGEEIILLGTMLLILEVLLGEKAIDIELIIVKTATVDEKME